MEDLNKKYNLKTVQTSLSKSPQDATEIAENFGYPVALKIESPDILHKSDIGAVKLNLKNKMEVLKAYDEIIISVKISCPSAKIEGISVQEMLPEGFEVIMGYTYGKVFGPVLMAGMGGIFTEALKDISFRALPITKDDAVSMITSLKSSDMLLKGFSHIKKIPIDVIIKASNLAMDNISKISSFDINPAIFYGSDNRIVDFKYTVQFGEFVCSNVLKNVPHRHFVFLIPKIIRIYFLYDRTLLKELSRIAWEVLSLYYKNAVNKKDAAPAAICSIQTFGDMLGFNPCFC